MAEEVTDGLTIHTRPFGAFKNRASYLLQNPPVTAISKEDADAVRVELDARIERSSLATKTSARKNWPATDPSKPNNPQIVINDQQPEAAESKRVEHISYSEWRAGTTPISPDQDVAELRSIAAQWAEEKRASQQRRAARTAAAPETINP